MLGYGFFWYRQGSNKKGEGLSFPLTLSNPLHTIHVAFGDYHRFATGRPVFVVGSDASASVEDGFLAASVFAPYRVVLAPTPRDRQQHFYLALHHYHLFVMSVMLGYVCQRHRQGANKKST